MINGTSCKSPHHTDNRNLFFELMRLPKSYRAYDRENMFMCVCIFATTFVAGAATVAAWCCCWCCRCCWAFRLKSIDLIWYGFVTAFEQSIWNGLRYSYRSYEIYSFRYNQKSFKIIIVFCTLCECMHSKIKIKIKCHSKFMAMSILLLAFSLYLMLEMCAISSEERPEEEEEKKKESIVETWIEIQCI